MCPPWWSTRMPSQATGREPGDPNVLTPNVHTMFLSLSPLLLSVQHGPNVSWATSRFRHHSIPTCQVFAALLHHVRYAGLRETGCSIGSHTRTPKGPQTTTTTKNMHSNAGVVGACFRGHDTR
ncbi:unnamed protein product [Ectocarpus sp. 12 AP-2014]